MKNRLSSKSKTYAKVYLFHFMIHMVHTTHKSTDYRVPLTKKLATEKCAEIFFIKN